MYTNQIKKFAAKIKQLIDLRPGKAKRPARMILVKKNRHSGDRQCALHYS